MSFTFEGKELSIYSEEGFEALSKLWLKSGWHHHYHYTFTWMGQPVLQLPEDLVRMQEVLFTLKPNVIIETGIAMGGSLLFYASICQSIGHGRVVGIDIDLRPHNRAQLQHPLITLIDGDSSAPSTLEKLELKPDEKVMVILDSNHSKAHVAKELELFAPLVTSGMYMVVADGFKKEVADSPRGKEYWEWDHPEAAAEEFLERHPEFVLEIPDKMYNRCAIRQTMTHLQGGWLKKR